MAGFTGFKGGAEFSTAGEVWLALNALGAWTAVKLVRRLPGKNDGAFEQEHRGLQRYDAIATSHESLMPIKSVGRADDGSFFYYAMELADDTETGEPLPRPMVGEPSSAQDLAAGYQPRTLSATLRNGRLPPPECIRHGLALAEALQRLHGVGLVHRDVKPANIILVGGRAKLADVGLVGLAEATVMTFVGTPEFVPFDGRGTASGDIYALGRVLYCMATGRPIADFNRRVENLKELPAAERAELTELEAVYDKILTRFQNRVAATRCIRRKVAKLASRSMASASRRAMRFIVHTNSRLSSP